MRKHHSCLILLFVLLVFASACDRKERQKPNFIFILVDDLGWTDLGCYNSTFYETPNIDKLASESMLFTQSYAACPVCSPTRAAIMTGKYPTRLNITDWIPGDDPKNRPLLGSSDSTELALDETTIAEVMRSNGYNTFFAGKWHLGNEGYFPEDQGFNFNFGGHHRGSPPGGYYTPYKNPKLIDGPEGEYLTDRLTEESLKFIHENKSNPFFLYLSYYTVHTPIEANKEYVDYYKSKLQLTDKIQKRTSEHNAFTTQNQLNPAYASMVHALDINVGKLLSRLEEEGIADNTIIIFTSDNGGLTTITSPNWMAPTSVKPLRAGKGWCYEGGIRVPMIIKVPGVTSSVSDYPVISMDLYPTILDLAGLPDMPDQHVDGLSLSLLILDGKRPEREELFWHYPHYHSSGWTPGAAVRKGDWKLIEFYELNKTELYDLRNDPGETIDLAGEMSQKVIELRERLKHFQNSTGSSLPIPNPDFVSN